MSVQVGHTITSLYFAEDWVDSWYDHNNQVMVMTWFNLSSSVHYRKAYSVQLEASRKLKPYALIIDTSKAIGRAYPEDHEWLTSYVFTEAKKLDLKFIINIFPKNFITRTGVKTIIDEARSHSFQVLEMCSLEAAYELVSLRKAVVHEAPSKSLSCDEMLAVPK